MPARPISVQAPVRRGIEDYGHSVLREERAHIDHLAVENFALVLVISWMRSEDLTEHIGFEYRDINPSIGELSFQALYKGRFSGSRKAGDPNGESVLGSRLHSRCSPLGDRSSPFPDLRE